jgi:spore coat protein U-like protein
MRTRLGFTLVVDGEIFGTAVTLSDARYIAGNLWSDKDRVQVWQNGSDGTPLTTTNHAGTRFVREEQ